MHSEQVIQLTHVMQHCMYEANYRVCGYEKAMDRSFCIHIKIDVFSHFLQIAIFFFEFQLAGHKIPEITLNLKPCRMVWRCSVVVWCCCSVGCVVHANGPDGWCLRSWNSTKVCCKDINRSYKPDSVRTLWRCQVECSTVCSVLC